MQSHDPHEPVTSVPDYAAALRLVEPTAESSNPSMSTPENEATHINFDAIATGIISTLNDSSSVDRATAVENARKQYGEGTTNPFAEKFARVLIDARSWDQKHSQLQILKSERNAEARVQGKKNLPMSPEEKALKYEVITLNHDLRELFEAKGNGFTTAELTQWYGNVLGEKMQTAAREISGVVAEVTLRKILSQADFLEAVQYGDIYEDAKGRDIVGLIKAPTDTERITLTADSKAGGQDTEVDVDDKLGVKIVMGVDLGRLDAYGNIDDVYTQELIFKAGLALQKAVVLRTLKIAERQAQSI